MSFDRGVFVYGALPTFVCLDLFWCVCCSCVVFVLFIDCVCGCVSFLVNDMFFVCVVFS